MNEATQCKKLTSSVKALGGILHSFIKMHQDVMAGVTQTASVIHSERCTGPLADAKMDAELNSSLRFGYLHDETSSIVTELFKARNFPLTGFYISWERV